MRRNFQPTVPLVAHFDGKLLAHLDGTKRDCLPIVVLGMVIEKLLGIPMLPVGTEALMGQNVVKFVRDWAGRCFDTTASNTGIHTEAISVVIDSPDRRLLFLTCRHHMLELEICALAVFDAFFTSKGNCIVWSIEEIETDRQTQKRTSPWLWANLADLPKKLNKILLSS